MLTVITGPMFSGKTTELIRRIHCAEIAGQITLVLKPGIDTRSGLEVVSHSGLRRPARNVEVASPFAIPQEVDVVGFDEAQFLGDAWVEVIDALASSGKEVVCACLNQDSRGKPFGIARELLALADNIVHLKSVCKDCGAKDAATKTFRTASSEERIDIGGSDKYIPLCRPCWDKRIIGAEQAALSNALVAAVA